MKNFSILLALMLLLFVGCHKEKKEVEVYDIMNDSFAKTEVSADAVLQVKSVKKEPKKFSFPLDSIIVNDSVWIKNKVNFDTNYQLLVFPSIDNKVLLDSIYRPISKLYNVRVTGANKKELLLRFRRLSAKNKGELIKKMKDIPEYDSERISYETCRMDIHYEKNDLVTVQYTFDGMSPGAAHPYHHYQWRTFDFRDGQSLQLSDILRLNEREWEKVVSKHIPEGLVFEEYEKSVPMTQNFYFDEKGISLLYNEYEIGAYTAGVISIFLPYEEVKPYLTKKFIKRMDIK